MKVSELKEKKVTELESLIQELKAELFKLRFQNSTGQLEHPHKIEQVKKDIARVFTIINQKESKVREENNGKSN